MSIAFFSSDPHIDTQKNRVRVLELAEQAALSLLDNQEEEDLVMQGELDPGLIQFYFCLDGEASFVFYRGQYRKSLQAGNCFLLYHPEGHLAYQLLCSPRSKVVALFVPVKRLHQWFVQDDQELSFLSQERASQRLYLETPVQAQLGMVLGGLFLLPPPAGTRHLFFQAKVLEILSLYFASKEEEPASNCPFLHDERNVAKIREAKKILKTRLIDPPGIPELARQIGLNEYQLKVGFKNIYGTTVHRYLTDCRLDQSRKLLDSGQLLVNEVAPEVGYSNPSHFIAAFKKKFGMTPKKYLSLLRGRSGLRT